MILVIIRAPGGELPGGMMPLITWLMILLKGQKGYILMPDFPGVVLICLILEKTPGETITISLLNRYTHRNRQQCQTEFLVGYYQPDLMASWRPVRLL